MFYYFTKLIDIHLNLLSFFGMFLNSSDSIISLYIGKNVELFSLAYKHVILKILILSLLSIEFDNSENL
jgi:hypothetical protein